jgi:pimeloyl-ACP methyl ester carboxylesterase
MKVKDLVIIHGLNNSKESFYPLKKALTKLGFRVHLFYLPGHRKLNKGLTLEESISYLEKQFDKLTVPKFYCLGFSQGGLVLELLPERIKRKIKKQVLLAPALAVRRSSFLVTVTKLLPAQMPFLSLAPSKLSKFSWLSVAYFDLLFQQLAQLSKIKKSTIPTLILVDLKDELIDVAALQEMVKQNKHFWQLELIERATLPFISVGQGHIVFHPKYFAKAEWKKLTQRIADFFILN